MRLPIENCRVWFKFRCPKGWSQLKRTGELDVRFCETCKKNVYLCTTKEEIDFHSAAGHCIVVEVEHGTRDALEGIDYIGEAL